MTRKWVPDRGWTGDWNMPALLRRPITQAERAILVFLSMEGLGPRRIARALEDAESISEICDAHPSRTRAALQALERLGARAIVASDDEYPEALAEICAAPPLLYVRGDRLDLLRPVVAVVGARACTSGAARFAAKLGEAFAMSGYTVCSGLARGIDAAAHRGALVGGRTIAVLGTGIDMRYPPEHRELAERVAASGALVTEFPPSVGPRAWHFPARNRIIAGLADALVVVEAGVSSGALITAGFALDEGRHVFACTTGPENLAGAGVREMLRDGAGLIVDPEQAVEVVSAALGLPLVELRATVRQRSLAGLGAEQRAVYEAVQEDSTVGEIAAHVGSELPRVAGTLAELELEGLVVCDAGRWRRAD